MPAESAIDSYGAAVEEFIRSHVDSAAVRRVVDDPGNWDERSWSIAAQQLDVPALLVPESLGGAGADLPAAAAAIRRLGAALAPGPYLGTVTAGAILVEAPEQFEAELKAIAAGSARFAVAFETFTDRGVLRIEQGRLNGTLRAVADAGTATHVLAVAGDAEAPILSVFRLDAPGVDVAPLVSLDPTRPQARIALDEVAAVQAPVAAETLARLSATATVLVSAEQVGIISRVLHDDVAYAKTRFAFGRPIGSFQAIKHQLAEFVCVLEHADAMLDYSASAAEDLDASTWQRTALELACVTGPAAVHVATEGLRLLGGIGFTWEHDAHLLLRRATANEYLLGDPYTRRDAMASVLGIGSIPAAP